MHQCYYLLQIYEDLIYGELEPVRLNDDKIDLGINYLKEEIDTCKDMQVVKVRVKKDDIQVLKKLNISNAHPLAKEYFAQRDLSFENNIEELLAKKIVNELEINSEKVLFTITKANNSIQYVGVCENSSWNKINNQRVKYCYYHQMLANCKKKVLSAIHLNVFELEEHQFKKLIYNIQKTLMFYIIELKKNHNINPKSLNYQLKDNYTDEDYISLIYISLVDLLNFLYENYDKEFDKTFEVPYFSEKINVNKIDDKIKIIKKHFKEHNIDPLLQEILNEQFKRIIGFDHPKRLTYHELDYFIELLNGLTKYLLFFKDRVVTAQNIISLLISYKFNSFKFIQYVTSEIQKDLSSINSLEEKRIHLLSEKKNIEQSFDAIKAEYDPESRGISSLLSEWIDKEIKLVEEYINNSINKPENQNEANKLNTSLSTRELSVLIKTLSDCDIILSKSQTDLARWLSANFRNENTDNISINQARNHLYNKDPFVLEKVKDLAIQLVNVINEKLSIKD